MRALLALLPLLALPAAAETPAERASRELNQGVQADRATEAVRTPSDLPATGSAQALEADRRSLQPDVGRPEERGSTPAAPERGALSGGPNPQR